MCQRIGLPPISTIGLSRSPVSSLRREPRPPARITAFTAADPTGAPAFQAASSPVATLETGHGGPRAAETARLSRSAAVVPLPVAPAPPRLTRSYGTHLEPPSPARARARHPRGGAPARGACRRHAARADRLRARD